MPDGREVDTSQNSSSTFKVRFLCIFQRDTSRDPQKYLKDDVEVSNGLCKQVEQKPAASNC